MNPFFNSPERIAKLASVARNWKDTPWCPNSTQPGEHGGVSCHNLPRQIYIECGALREDFPQIVALPSQAAANNMMETLLDSRPEFYRIPRSEFRIPHSLQPGDLLGLWLARDEGGRRVRTRHTNHLGIVLDKFYFVHTLIQKNTDFDQHNVPPWLQRIVAVWRPLEP